jgi:hypothetical protein
MGHRQPSAKEVVRGGVSGIVFLDSVASSPPPHDVAPAALARHFDAERVRGRDVQGDVLAGEDALRPAVPVEHGLPRQDEQAGEKDHDAGDQGRDHPGETEPAPIGTERADLRRRLQAGRTEPDAFPGHGRSIAGPGVGPDPGGSDHDRAAVHDKLRARDV